MYSFQGQCVVLGGDYNNYIDKKVFKTVESYDHHLDKWSFLPEMQAARYKPGVFTKGNKLFAICGVGYLFYFLKTSEVYDSISKKFTFIASFPDNLWTGNLFCTYSNGRNIIVIYGNYYCFYNITTNIWSESHLLESEKTIKGYSCVEVNKLIK